MSKLQALIGIFYQNFFYIQNFRLLEFKKIIFLFDEDHVKKLTNHVITTINYSKLSPRAILRCLCLQKVIYFFFVYFNKWDTHNSSNHLNSNHFPWNKRAQLTFMFWSSLKTDTNTRGRIPASLPISMFKSMNQDRARQISKGASRTDSKETGLILIR